MSQSVSESVSQSLSLSLSSLSPLPPAHIHVRHVRVVKIDRLKGKTADADVDDLRVDEVFGGERQGESSTAEN